MALPTAYLTSQKNLSGILDAIRGAQAPEKFTVAFLESLEFKSSPDRLVVRVLKSLGFLDDTGKPAERYFSYLDRTQSERVMAEAIKDAYEDLFRVNVNAQKMGKQEVVNKFKTLSQGKISDSVLDKMAMTFTSLVRHADFEAVGTAAEDDESESSGGTIEEQHDHQDGDAEGITLGGLVYNIQIVLPESRDQAVYDALFQSLKKHLR